MEAGHLSKHERLLQSEDPVLNFQRREEALVQRRLDHGTQRISKDLQQRNELTRRETQRINKTIEDRFYQLIANTPGLEVRNPATERREIDPKQQQHNNTNTAALSRSKQQQSHTAAPQPQGPTTSRSTHTRTNKTTTSNNNTAPAAIAVGPDACPTSNYSVCFPTPFDQSGFSSVLSWADVSYQEATVSALGPRADVAKIRQTELPNRLLVSIACYLMNEVLSRDSSMCELWKILRVPIFDAVFSPRLIATEMRRRVDEESGAVPRPEVGEVQPLPHRQARYDNLHDFASYRLWTEEFLSARRENEALAHRIHELKGVVLKSRLVLQMAQRRVDQARKQIFFNAWRTYTRRTKAFREAAMKYLTHNKRRALEESSFLRWRRMTLQTKIDVMQEQLLELNHRLRQESKASGAIISALRTKIEEEERIKEGLLLKDEALRSQMMESHLMESRALRLVLSKKHQHFLSMKAHARRWERLAKTYRPLMLCPAVPPSAMAAGLALRRLEEEVASGKCTAGYRSTPIRHNIEMILMRWTNLIMSTATLPGGRKWRKVGMIDRRATGGGSGNAFTLYTLLDVVRELRRSYAEELSSDILQQINAWVAEQDQRNRLTSSSSSAASSEDFLKPREGADAMLTYMLHQSGAEAGEAPPHPLASLFHEVCVVLYLQTSEGLYPSLITHCAVLPTFFHAAGFMKLSHLNLLWVLSALFTGWVHRRCGAESMLPSVAPEYLRCREEARLAQRPNPAITTAVRELQSVDHHQQQQQHALTSPTNGGGLGAYVVSSNTKIGKYAPTTASSMGDARMSVATTAHTGLSTPSIAKITCQCSKLEDLSLVRAGADTAADVEVYVGIKNEEVFWSEDEDVDDVLADVVDAEQRELVRRRRARAGQLELHEQENRGRTTKCPPEPPHFRDEASMSDVEELLHAQEDSMDDVEASLTAEDLQELRSGAAHIEDLLAAHKKKQDEDAIYTLSSVKQSILTPPQIQLIANLPPPTLAFDVPRPKGRAVAKKALKKRANTTTAYTNANNNNNNNNNVRGRRGRARGYRGSDEDEDEEEAYLAYATDADVWRRRTRRIAVHTFLTLTQADSERRRQWLGLARIITSLATRFRALDSAATLAAAAEAAGAAPPPPPAGGGGGGGGASRRSTKGRRTASASPNVSAAGGAGPTTTTASATPALGRTSANSSRAATTAEPTLAASPSPLHLEGRFGTGGGATASARRAAATHNTTTTTTTTNTNTNTTTMNVASSLSGRNASAHHDSSRVVEVEDPEDEHLRSSSGGGGGGAGVASSHAATHRHAKALRHHHALPPIDLPPTHGDGGTERSASTQRSNRGAPPPLLSLASPPPEQPTEEILMMDGAAPTTSSSTHIEPLPPQPGNTATVSFGATAPTTTTATLGAPPPQRKRRESDTAVVAPDRRDLLRQFQQRFAEAPPSDADHSQQQQQQQQQHRMEVLSSGRRSPPPVNAPVVVPTPQPVSSDDRIVAMENFANIRRSPRAAATRLLSPHGRIEMPSDGPLEPLYIHTEPLVAPPRPRDRFDFDERSKR